MATKTTKRRKSKAAPQPARLTLVDRANVASKHLATIETNVSAFRVATLGDESERAANIQGTGPVSLDNTLLDLCARLEVLARETRRINLRLGQ